MISNKMRRLLTAIPSHPEHMTEVTPASNEYYFRYKKQAMSIMRRGEDHQYFGKFSFYIYPGYEGTLVKLRDALENDPASVDDMPMASHHSRGESLAPFTQLYELLEAKHLGLDKLLDDLLDE